MTCQRHVPYQPLHDYIIDSGRVWYAPTPINIARVVGFDRQNIHRAIHTGDITIWMADRAAVALDTHPALIWGDDWRRVAEADDGRCAIGNCRRPIEAQGWCDIHYERWRRTGDPRRRAPATCRECGSPAHGKGLCNRHYQRARKVS